ncbi:hypothetical protein [Alkalinema sp. FACHB-956]|uniref:hypothetical protein n=1 Tax=Alkalinema sp. FACHB-956 TaxID=2692768 RepID=UPI00168625A4|nr:hypothetical protein [Alkalinema sp. FACHB-956]MBD2325987.1 hypothetical protein [Alkalinema sp. FACHB-956]
MSTQERARALMVNQRQNLRNRKQCMTSRYASGLGLSTDTVGSLNQIEGDVYRAVYNRGQVGLN